MSRTIVVGAGMVGLATAWHLQERGVEVTVIDRVGVGAGSSWGNAGWLTPGKTIPLADTGLWTYGPKALLDPDAALHVPFRVDPGLWMFLGQFAAHGTNRAWDKTMADLTPIDKIALECFDELIDGGVKSWTREGPFVIGFKQEADSKGFLHEIEGVVRHGQDVPFERLENPRELAPVLSDAVTHAYRLDGQRFFEPAPFLEALGAAVVERGAELITGYEVTDVSSTRRPVVTMSNGQRLEADSVVIATGAWMPALARKLGVRTRVQAGRGYSFTVSTEVPQEHPVYFPSQRIACTPYQGRFRIAGTMEFRGPDEPFQPRRVQAIIAQAREMFVGLDLDDRQDEWVGSRPVTPDGLPLVGATQAPNVYVAGGHGMWGIVLGPATGKLLAEQITTGRIAEEIRPFNPLR
ncbi:NAD(P)/FAD-dependent oxidoreductase [Microbacterium esteraromaticum]|uniref:NAD(P)/FAD-dependent oxidoreductase n=1 Tax=Microbacterium esteraromaticum TaxID=57043 RepID=UPI00195D13A8|nr:FAD-binding oxidoreductase [Microbacterium esteraromaticum]MBM7466181.1 D-amino-acid dehydrogenase [Microbacterium esteraromaticum]